MSRPQSDSDPDDESERMAAMQREEANAIAGIMQVYAGAFDDFDPEPILDLFQFPCVIWQFGKGHVFEDEDALSENISALFKVYERERIVRSLPQIQDIAISGASAIAAVDWTAEAEDGEAAFAFSVVYHLIKQSGDWFIAMVVNEDPDEPPPLPPVPLPPE